MVGEGRGGSRRHPPVLTHRHLPSSSSADGAGDTELGTRHRHLVLSTRSAAAGPASTVAKEEDGAEQQALLGGGGEAGSRGAVGPRDAEVPDGPSHGGSGSGSSRIRAKSTSAAFSAKGAKGPFARWLDLLSPSLKFAVLVGCVMVSFGLHNILQESLFGMEGFNFGWSLGMLEAVGVLVGSMLERAHSGEAGKRVAPFKSYVVLAGILGVSSSLSNMALHYIKYPTKVIFRSCKLIPTMIIAVVWRKKIVSRWEFLAAFAVCSGLVIFGLANRKLEPDFDVRGIGMVMLSVCADAFLPNMQEHVFSMGASRVEVTFFTNSLTVLGMLVSTAANGNLMEFLKYAITSRAAMTRMLVYCIMSHVAIAAHMMVLKEYGGVTAVLVGNTRKSMTIALSFFLFPKPFSYHFVLGGALVLGGLAANVMIKERRKARKAPADALEGKSDASPDVADVESGGKAGEDIGGNGNGNGNLNGGIEGTNSHRSPRARSRSFSSALPAKNNRDRVHHQDKQQQKNGPAGNNNGHVQDGPLPSWRPRLGGRFSPWRGRVAAVPSAGEGPGRIVAFGGKVDGEAIEPLLVSNGRGAAGSSRQ